MAPHKYETVASLVRDMIADGTLKPGAPAPSGAALAREKFALLDDVGDLLVGLPVVAVQPDA